MAVRSFSCVLVALLLTCSSISRNNPNHILPILEYPREDLNITIQLTQTVILECITSGSPPPKFTWIKSEDGVNTTLTSSSSIEISNRMNVLDYTLPNGTVLADGYRETLTLMKARQEDIGIYFCVADNNRGIGSIMIELIGGTEHVKSVNK